MIFRGELAEQVMTGRKTVTRRTVSDNPRSYRHPGRAPKLVGKRIAICPGRGEHRIGRALVVSVERQPSFHPLRITDAEAKREGFGGWKSFCETWERLHGQLADTDVWRIELAEPRRTDAREQAEPDIASAPDQGEDDGEERSP